MKLLFFFQNVELIFITKKHFKKFFLAFIVKTCTFEMNLEKQIYEKTMVCSVFADFLFLLL
ncbi:MAG: hypothetical protein CVU05_06735 [Bacteroidetes bacterium HGW-Bacteroidetes-21]|nr:MAG: hypothetical protein CVU05_06735 [Bacteroidetes bacterium HGW-Bacteroidetes-21]